MAQVIQSGFRNINPTDYGAGNVQKQLNDFKDRSRFEKDRDFRVKLEDRRYVDKLLMDAATNGVKMNDEKVTAMRDQLAEIKGKADSKEYRAKQAELYSEIQQSNSNFQQNLRQVKAQYEYAQANRLLIKPEGWEILNNNLSNPSDANMQDFWDKGVDMDMSITDWAQNNFKDLERTTTTLYDRDDATIFDKKTYAPEFWKEVNGRLVQKTADEVNNEILDAAVKDPSVLGERRYRYVETKALERKERRLNQLENDGIPDEQQQDEFDKLTTTNMMKAILVERIAQSNKPSEDKSSSRTNFDILSSSAQGRAITAEQDAKEMDWVGNRSVAALNKYNRKGWRYEYGEPDENGSFDIKVFHKETDDLGVFKKEVEYPSLKIDPNDPATISSSLSLMRGNADSDTKEITGSPEEKAKAEKTIQSSEIQSAAAAAGYAEDVEAYIEILKEKGVTIIN